MEFLLKLRRRGIMDQAVLRAIDEVPREHFVGAQFAKQAYADEALPIACGQTISQPYVVAYMTEQLALRPHHRVLEIGTGSGYQAAVLAELVAKVYTIEILEPVGKRAEADLAALGYRNIAVRIGDGYLGWPEAAPFDGIVVTAAAPHVPQPLVEQLKPGGRLVIPVGAQWQVQELLVIEKKPDGSTVTTRTIPVRFVPLTRPR
jgi:protein-L-isoaspartate(D-aspartate) O-methyltransferase